MPVTPAPAPCLLLTAPVVLARPRRPRAAAPRPYPPSSRPHLSFHLPRAFSSVQRQHEQSSAGPVCWAPAISVESPPTTAPPPPRLHPRPSLWRSPASPRRESRISRPPLPLSGRAPPCSPSSSPSSTHESSCKLLMLILVAVSVKLHCLGAMIPLHTSSWWRRHSREAQQEKQEDPAQGRKGPRPCKY
ncbi:unnamed protein product [Urochloa humidicola]